MEQAMASDWLEPPALSFRFRTSVQVAIPLTPKPMHSSTMINCTKRGHERDMNSKTGKYGDPQAKLRVIRLTTRNYQKGVRLQQSMSFNRGISSDTVYVWRIVLEHGAVSASGVGSVNLIRYNVA